MNTKHACRWATTVVRSLVLCALPGFAVADAAAAGDAARGATSYEQMARLELYLIPDSHTEIALARSAARPQSSFSNRRDTRGRSTEPTDSPALWRGRGCRRSPARNSGIRS
jgi:hypothetical protein